MCAFVCSNMKTNGKSISIDVFFSYANLRTLNEVEMLIFVRKATLLEKFFFLVMTAVCYVSSIFVMRNS